MIRVALGAALVVAGCNAAVGQDGEAAAEATPAPTAPARVVARRVETATVELTEATFPFRLAAEVKPSRESRLAAANGGFVERVLVEEGDRVTEGQVLARVDTQLYGARLESSRVAVEEAERELGRARRLGDAVPDAQRDSAQTAERAARASLRAAAVQAARSVIRSPFDGVVAEVMVERGEVVGVGEPLVHVVQLDPIRARLSLSDRELVVVREGMPVSLVADSIPTPVEGRVVFIRPIADARTRSFHIEIEAANPDQRLRPGMLGFAHVVSELGGEMLILPQDVLVTRRTGNGVFVHRDGVARWRDLELGPIVRDQVVVVGGLAPSDEVVITGHRELADGDPVVVVRRGRCCERGRVTFPETP